VVQFGMKGCVVGHTCRSFARASLTSSLRSIAQVGDAWHVERTRVTNTLPHLVILSESEESKLAPGRTAAGSPRLRSLCFAAQRHVNPWGLVGRDFRCFAAAQHDRLARRVIRERARAHPEIKYLLQWTTPKESAFTDRGQLSTQATLPARDESCSSFYKGGRQQRAVQRFAISDAPQKNASLGAPFLYALRLGREIVVGPSHSDLLRSEAKGLPRFKQTQKGAQRGRLRSVAAPVGRSSPNDEWEDADLRVALAAPSAEPPQRRNSAQIVAPFRKAPYAIGQARQCLRWVNHIKDERCGI